MCFTNGLLELWSFDEAAINALTKEDILRKINQPVIIRCRSLNFIDKMSVPSCVY